MELKFNSVVLLSGCETKMDCLSGLPMTIPYSTPEYIKLNSNGHRASLAANAIAENLFAQIDGEGNHHVLFEEIMDHRTNGKQVLQQDAFIVNRSGTRRRRETTIGWELLVRWKDSSNLDCIKGLKGVISSPIGGVCCEFPYC